MLQKHFIFTLLFISFIIYSLWVYTVGTDRSQEIKTDFHTTEGKLLYQKYNCTACHQIYGLGGYLGPDITTVMSQKGKEEIYARAILKTGMQRMPDFSLSDEEINNLITILKYVNTTAVIYKSKT